MTTSCCWRLSRDGNSAFSAGGSAGPNLDDPLTLLGPHPSLAGGSGRLLRRLSHLPVDLPLSGGHSTGSTTFPQIMRFWIVRSTTPQLARLQIPGSYCAHHFIIAVSCAARALCGALTFATPADRLAPTSRRNCPHSPAQARNPASGQLSVCDLLGLPLHPKICGAG